ncbi:hypothetical protein, partial [Embleya sp. NPDC005575]|uniref:hypothetical protein n=1 Tax=Embleya sp. NPDC005575 TaxID=3156892 RepID=UPI0033AAEB6E
MIGGLLVSLLTSVGHDVIGSVLRGRPRGRPGSTARVTGLERAGPGRGRRSACAGRTGAGGGAGRA